MNIIGRWKIAEMESWDLEFIDLTEPGFIAFKKGGQGRLHFGCVDVELDWRHQAGEERADFTFEGFDEGDAVSGRGWAKVEGKTLEGFIAFHLGEESGFKARKRK